MKKTTKILAFAATAAVAFTAGCGSEDTAPTTAADTIVVSSAWTKAAESGMTGSFAELENTGDQDVQVVAVSSPVSSRSELHEMAPGADGGMAMRQMDGGLTIPAGGEHSLAPGADHLMLMDLLEPVTPGTEIALTLTFSDGSSTEFTSQVRDFAGGREKYVPSTPEGANHGG
ncbi:copper chaperone PCu(A)C [Rhodococcus zopfii]|uniref:Copper chaperone PCu(A)C n=1 Tax=Rhodococcus zopfii TaxID=43772 RepID=A0ABU3WUZ5_9NOCA|nr:copper chaperone PCu(A)C [Rhodococcus zopfii]MDV2477822.1 copper chaperone PCu(A)C [Rhodococcus zopfii]